MANMQPSRRRHDVCSDVGGSNK